MATASEYRAAYTAQGIEYKGGKIRTPWGEWIYPVLKFGTNTKVGEAATFSLYHGNETFTVDDFGPKTRAAMVAASIHTIQGSCPCHCVDCYCDAGRYHFDANKKTAIVHLILARVYPDFLRRAIVAQLIADRFEQIRIHAQGDFCTDEYTNIWADIAEQFPGVIFWTYTKNAHALEVFKRIDNVFITPSCTPVGFNFGTCAELLNMHRLLTAQGYKVHICACGTDMQKHCSECKHGCKAVGMECDFVLFIKHSTKDYKAGKDDPEEFKAVCEIIAGQNN